MDRGALLEELRVGAVAHPRQPARVELGAHPLAGADRHGALHDQDVARLGADALELGDHPHDPRQVGVARVGRRGVDGHEHDVRPLEQELERQREGDPLGVLGQQLGEARLVDRDLAPLQRRHLLLVDVADRHLEPQRGEADAGDQADVAGPDHAHALALSGPAAGRRPLRPTVVHGVEPSSSTETSVSVRPFLSLARLSGRIDLAISSMVLALRSFSSVLETQ